MPQKRRTPIILALALVCGAAAAVLSVSYIRQMQPRLVAAPSRQVLVALQDLPVGTLLKPEHVRMVKWPADAIPLGYYSAPGDVVGRGLTTPVRANEPLLAGKVAGKGEGAGLPPLIPEGMRALSVSVSQVVAVAGFVIPGSRVDVLLTVEKDGEPLTKVFLQNMTVLAANQSMVEDAEGKPMKVSIVTFLVDPDQAEKLTLATQEGKIQLVLRNRVDVAEVKTRGAVRPDLLGASRAASGEPTVRRAVRPAAEPRASSGGEPRPARGETVVETYRGGQKTLSTFSNES